MFFKKNFQLAGRLFGTSDPEGKHKHRKDKKIALLVTTSRCADYEIIIQYGWE